VIRPDLAVTCAHVLEGAGAAPGEQAVIRFGVGQAEPLRVWVLKGPGLPEDAAFVRLPGLPEGVEPAVLGRAAESGGHPYCALGFPKPRVVEARYASGQIRGVVPGRGEQGAVLQLEGVEISAGMSGAPVLDESLGRVVGMVAQGQDETYTRIAYAVTAETLAACDPEIRLLGPDPAPRSLEGVVRDLLAGLERLPTRYDGQVRNFLEAYLGSASAPRLFGGRDAELAALDAWLADPRAAPYLGIFEPAGMGKSALVVQWVHRLALAERPLHVVFFPISIRYSTNLPNVVFAGWPRDWRRPWANRKCAPTAPRSTRASSWMPCAARPRTDARCWWCWTAWMRRPGRWGPGCSQPCRRLTCGWW
jgi:hypothetical protein